MYSLVTTMPGNGTRIFELFDTETELFRALESRGVTYYAEVGATRLANGFVYEYGQVGK